MNVNPCALFLLLLGWLLFCDHWCIAGDAESEWLTSAVSTEVYHMRFGSTLHWTRVESSHLLLYNTNKAIPLIPLIPLRPNGPTGWPDLSESTRPAVRNFQRSCSDSASPTVLSSSSCSSCCFFMMTARRSLVISGCMNNCTANKRRSGRPRPFTCSIDSMRTSATVTKFSSSKTSKVRWHKRRRCPSLMTVAPPVPIPFLAFCASHSFGRTGLVRRRQLVDVLEGPADQVGFITAGTLLQFQQNVTQLAVIQRFNLFFGINDIQLLVSRIAKPKPKPTADNDVSRVAKAKVFRITAKKYEPEKQMTSFDTKFLFRSRIKSSLFWRVCISYCLNGLQLFTWPRNETFFQFNGLNKTNISVSFELIKEPIHCGPGKIYRRFFRLLWSFDSES